MSETIEIEGDLILSEDRKFDKSIRVEGDIKREEGTYPNQDEHIEQAFREYAEAVG